MRCVLVILLALLFARPLAACETALLLAVDVSSSISPTEYEIQMQGLADALGDPRIVAALVDGQSRLALVHWSGQTHQRLTLRWQSIQRVEDVKDFAATIRQIKRPQLRSVTAIGQAIRFSLTQFAEVADCGRAIIDISGDGEENENWSLPEARNEAIAAGVMINAIAIELGDADFRLTDYFRRFVITPGGFVITATGVDDYPRAIRAKLLREIFKNVG
jgi:Ca-activated chloride channel homolog